MRAFSPLPDYGGKGKPTSPYLPCLFPSAAPILALALFPCPARGRRPQSTRCPVREGGRSEGPMPTIPCPQCSRRVEFRMDEAGEAVGCDACGARFFPSSGELEADGAGQAVGQAAPVALEPPPVRRPARRDNSPEPAPAPAAALPDYFTAPPPPKWYDSPLKVFL